MKTKIKKILIVTGIFPPSIGGPATYSKLLLDKLPEYGFKVEVISFDGVRRFPKFIRHIIFLLRILKKAVNADLLFAQDTVSVGLPALVAAKLLNKRFFLRVPGDYAWEQARGRFGVKDGIDSFQTRKYGVRIEFLRFVQRLVARHADRVIAPSLYFKNLVSKWVIDSERIHLIYNGIDLSLIFNPPKDFVPKTMISAGRLVPWKGFDELITSLEFLSDWELVIAGDGPDMERLKILADTSGVGERVLFLGRLSHEELIFRIQQAEVFVLNSSFESFSFQLVEAMAAGTPVVVANIGNISEIVTDGQDGILFPPKDFGILGIKLREISNDPVLRTRLVAAGRKRAENFSIERTIKELVVIIESV